MAQKSKFKSEEQDQRKQNKFSGKGKRPYRGKKSSSSRKEASAYDKTEASNDIRWHVQDAELLRLSSSLSWSYSTGDLFEVTPQWKDQNSNGPWSASEYTLPGIMSIAEIPWVGGAEAEGTYPPATYAANTLLTEMRSRTRIRNTYDAPDVMQKMLAMASIYAGIAWAKRLYGTLKMYTYQSEYLPDALFAAQHFDPTSLRNDPYSFLGRLNVIISNVNKIYVPNTMPLFEYYTQRYSNYYSEGSSIKDQLYVIYPATLNYLHKFTVSNKAYVELQPCLVAPNNGPATYNLTTEIASNVQNGALSITGDQLLDALDFMVGMVINDSDTPDITGDLQNAFGDGNRFVIPQITPDVMAVPFFDEEVLEMIQNSYCPAIVHEDFKIGSTKSWTGTGHLIWMIFQDPGTNRIGNYNNFQLAYNATNAPYFYKTLADASNPLITVHKDPDAAKTCLITRNRATVSGTYVGATGSGSNTIRGNVHASGSLIVRYEVFWFKTDSNTNKPALQTYSFCNAIESVTEKALVPFGKISVFHYHPILQLFTAAQGTFEDYFGELDIIAQITSEQIVEINRIDMLTALGGYNKF